MNLLLFVALIFAALEALAVWRDINRLEYIAKPAVMLCLFGWLYLTTDLKGAAIWFGIGVILSLVGDVLLIFIDRFFIPGLISFLMVHIAYIIGLGQSLGPLNAWAAILVLILGLVSARILRSLITGLKEKQKQDLILPVGIYSLVISLMLLLAIMTLTNPGWQTHPALLVSSGALLFYLSDLVLAWNRFVAPLKHGRLLNITLYQLGQIALVAGVISQFS
jgi:uncharacterized membrane protein YhhN